MSFNITFTVPGVPVPKARARIGKNGGYTPAKTKLYETKVAYYAREAMAGRTPAVGAVCVQLRIYLPIPRSFSQSNKEAARLGIMLHISKPDISNIQKGIEDAMNGIVYHDDSQIFGINATKDYSDDPRVEVKVVS